MNGGERPQAAALPHHAAAIDGPRSHARVADQPRLAGLGPFLESVFDRVIERIFVGFLEFAEQRHDVFFVASAVILRGPQEGDRSRLGGGADREGHHELEPPHGGIDRLLLIPSAQVEPRFEQRPRDGRACSSCVEVGGEGVDLGEPRIAPFDPHAPREACGHDRLAGHLAFGERVEPGEPRRLIRPEAEPAGHDRRRRREELLEVAGIRIRHHDPFGGGVARGCGLDGDAVIRRLHLHEQIDRQPGREGRERKAAGLHEGGGRQFVADRREPLRIDERDARLRHEPLMEDRGQAVDGDDLRLPHLLGGELPGRRLNRRAHDCRGRRRRRVGRVQQKHEQGEGAKQRHVAANPNGTAKRNLKGELKGDAALFV